MLKLYWKITNLHEKIQLSQDLMWFNINHLHYSNAKNENEKWDVLTITKRRGKVTVDQGHQKRSHAFKYFDFERTWWRVFQKHAVSTKSDLLFAMQHPLRSSILSVDMVINHFHSNHLAITRTKHNLVHQRLIVTMSFKPTQCHPCFNRH